MSDEDGNDSGRGNSASGTDEDVSDERRGNENVSDERRSDENVSDERGSDESASNATGNDESAQADPLADVPEGLTHEETWEVGEIEPQTVADGVAVAATPEIIGFAEQTVYDGVVPRLPEGHRVVGVRVECDHRAPTPAGEAVRVRIEVEEVDSENEQVVSTATVEDDRGVAATCRTRHAVVDREAFAERVKRRFEAE